MVLRLVGLMLLFAACLGCASDAFVVVPDGERLPDAAQEAYRTAARRLRGGRAESALDALAPALRVEPWHVPSHRLRQRIMTELGRGEDALEWYTAAAADRSDDAVRAVLAARLQPRAGGRREAAYRAARALDPASPWPGLALGFELLHTAQAARVDAQRLADAGDAEGSRLASDRRTQALAESKGLATAVVESRPDLADAHALLAEILLLTAPPATGPARTEVLEAAREHARECVRNDARDVAAHVRLARVLRALSSDEEAEQALAEAVRLDPADAGLRASHGRVLLDLGRPEEALDSFEAAREQLPDDADFWHDLGVVRHRVGDLDGAVGAFERAENRRPGDVRTLEALLLVHVERGDRRAAIAAAERYEDAGGPDDELVRDALREVQGGGTLDSR